AVENFRMEDVRANLRSSLPAYMMPTHFVEMESMPRNQSRKIDRSRLPGLDSLVADRGREFVAPATPEETHMIELWADVLKQEPEAISMDDNFFLIGGHSMLATQLIARIREAFAVDLPLLTIFEAPTANGLLASILTCKLQGAGDLSALMSEFDDMSDEEIEALLAKELTQN
ncbi:MAG: phosphopantetheine-binding protein, partial [Tumebacillaceae bacterium]